MKNIFSLKDNSNFSLISGDKNKIHLDSNFTKNLFVRLPIVHGSHIIIIALLEYLKKNRKKNYFIKSLNIKFTNYLNINQKFIIILKRKKITVKTCDKIILEININCLEKKNRKNNKETYIKKYKFPNLVNQSIIKELMDISKYIGSNNPGNGSLILNLDIIFQKNTKNKIIKRKITNQVFHFSLFKKNYKSNLIVSKLNEFKITFNKFTRKKSEILSLKNKSILIFGSSGNLGSYAKFFFSKYNVLLNLADRDPTSINKKKLKFFKINIKNENNLRKIILNSKPDYIFYFLSPRIQKISNLKFDKKLFKDFNFVYYIYLKKIIKNLNLLNKKVALFYPSTIALDTTHNNFKFLKEYILAKAKAEKICNNTINNVKIISYRIPQIKSPQNYNIAGFYEGYSVNIMKKYFNNFLSRS